MNTIEQFNQLHGTIISRASLTEFRQKAETENISEIVTRIDKLFSIYPNDDSFVIEIANPIKQQVEGLGVAENNHADDLAWLSACLEYQSEPDEVFSGLGTPVSANEIYDYITDMMVNTIKQVGHLPWQKEWTGSGGIADAKNYVTNKPYTGINFFMLNFDVIKIDGKDTLVPINFTQPYYLTFNQIKDAEASLKKGSKSHKVFYFTIMQIYKDENLNFSTSDQSKYTEFIKLHNLSELQLVENGKRVPIIKYYNVYRADDCEGLNFDKKQSLKKEVNTIDAAQSIIDDYPNPPKYTFVGDKAYYMPSKDIVNMPKIEAFSTEEYYYSTYFHEIIHSTGHPTRIDRKGGKKFGDDDYAFEELIAELGAVFLCGEAGILFSTRENSAKYLKGWNQKLVSNMENDNRFFIKASAQAQKAATFILNVEEKTKVVEKPKKQPKPKKTKPTGQLALFGAYKSISSETFKNMSVSELRRFTLDYYNEYLKGKKVLIQNRLKEVAFETKAGRKMLKPMYSEKAAVLEHLESLIKTSVYNNWGKRKTTDNPTVLGYLNFKSKITIDGVKRHVRISIVLDRDRKTKLKTFEVGKKKESGKLHEARVRNPKDEGSKPLSDNKDTQNGLNSPSVAPKFEISADYIEPFVMSVQTQPQAQPVENTEVSNQIEVQEVEEIQPIEHKPINRPKNPLVKSMADKSHAQNFEYYKIKGQLADFLGNIEIKPKESVAITLDGSQGSGKTRLLFQMQDLFASAGYTGLFVSLEEHPESALFKEKQDLYIDSRNLSRIDTVSELPNGYADLLKLIPHYDVIYIDSWSKLAEMEKALDFDRDLRKAFDSKLFVVIFQRTVTGGMRGGTKAGFDGDIIMKTEKDSTGDFRNNYAYYDKHRYTNVPLNELKYNIYSQELIQV